MADQRVQIGLIVVSWATLFPSSPGVPPTIVLWLGSEMVTKLVRDLSEFKILGQGSLLCALGGRWPRMPLGRVEIHG